MELGSMSEMFARMKTETEEWNAGRECEYCGISDGNLSVRKFMHEDCRLKKESDEKLEKEKNDFNKWKDKIKNEHASFSMWSGVGMRHSVCTFDNFIGDCDTAKMWLESKSRENLVIQSERSGNGKTHIAVSVLKEYAKLSVFPVKNKPVFIQFTEMMQFIKSSFDSSNLTESDIVKYFCDPELLIIDDIGSEKVTEYTSATLYIILNRRYESNKPTIVATNETSATLTEKYGSRIVSRLVSGVVQKVVGSDNRITKSVMHDYTGIKDERRTIDKMFRDWDTRRDTSFVLGAFFK